MSQQPVHQAPSSDPEGTEVPAATETTADATTSNPTSDPASGEAAPTTETTADAGTGNPSSDPTGAEVPNTHTEDTADATEAGLTGSDPTSSETPGVTETTADASTKGGGTDEGADAPTAAEVTASNALDTAEHVGSASPQSDPMGTDTPPTTGF